MKKTDNINKYCIGILKGKVCSHFDKVTKECILLRNGTVRDVFKKETNCYPGFIKQTIEVAVKIYLKKPFNKDDMHEIINNMWVKLLKEPDKKKSKDKKPGKLKNGYNIENLKSYIRSACYYETCSFFKKICRRCIYLPLSKPYLCQRETILTGKGEQPNPLYGKVRRPSDPKCKEGFKAFPDQSLSQPDSDDETSSFIIDAQGQRVTRSSIGTSITKPGNQAEEDLQEAVKKIENRIYRTKNSEKKEIYERQHRVFMNIIDLSGQSPNRTHSIKVIAKKFKETEKKIWLDWKEIKNFLKENVS